MRRRKIAVVVVAALVAAGASTPADAAKKKKKPVRVERQAEANYTAPAIGSRDLTGTCVGDTSGCPTFGVAATERYLALEIEDDQGRPVPATIAQDTDTSNANFVEVIARICGATEEPIPIEPGLQVYVWVWATPAVNPPCLGFASSGKVTATFSNLP